MPQSAFPASRPVAILLALAALVVVAGCGGGRHAPGGTPATTGSAVVQIPWPAPEPTEVGRTIPAATQSIVLRLFTDRELTEFRRVITRPASAATVAVRFQNLPLGPVLFVAEAHSDTAGEALPLLASGSQTVTITPGDPVPVTITLSAASTATSGETNTGVATVIVSDIPERATRVTVRVLRNGQVIPGVGEPAPILRTSDLPFSAVPLRLTDLPLGSLLFVATADGPSSTDPTQRVTIAQGSKIAEVTAGAEVTVGVPLVQGTGTIPGDTAQSTPTTASVVVNITNIGASDVLLVVDPMPGDRTLADPAPVQVLLQGSFVTSG
ncbi:MAG: hypothetical protein QHJ73_06985, partial [Armatimonadota bacterium]|nr:hypothetical protein [Armatimonadota bacterium]